MQLSSPAFGDNQPIPDTYTVKGDGISPPLVIAGVPNDAKSLALVMHDPDAPIGDFLHWTVWNIPPTTTAWAEGSVPEGATEGQTDYGQVGYGQPAPPSGTHRYTFELYALSAPLQLPAGAGRAELMSAIQDHTIATCQLIGVVSA